MIPFWERIKYWKGWPLFGKGLSIEKAGPFLGKNYGFFHEVTDTSPIKLNVGQIRRVFSEFRYSSFVNLLTTRMWKTYYFRSSKEKSTFQYKMKLPLRDIWQCEHIIVISSANRDPFWEDFTPGGTNHGGSGGHGQHLPYERYTSWLFSLEFCVDINL